jgi:HlyD family secretion protein
VTGVQTCALPISGLAIAGSEGLWCACAIDNNEPAGPATPAGPSAPAKKVVATGTVEAEEFVDVGAQVAGTIVRFGADPKAKGKTIDYGSQVEAGTVLAEIDNALYVVRVDQERASVLRARAEVKQATIALEHAAAQWKHAQALKPTRAISDTDLEQARCNHKLAEAALEAAKAALLQNEAALKRAEIELGYTTIRSPIKGVVIDRRANVGQIVGPAANGPSLFLVADLERLEVWATVNEADVARIRAQQPVRFTVAAFPGMVFKGFVKKIRPNAVMTQNVVTYTVVIAISGSTGKLLPYLTANVEFE